MEAAMVKVIVMRKSEINNNRTCVFYWLVFKMHTRLIGKIGIKVVSHQDSRTFSER
jgi:hypothetical protein